MPRYKKVDDDGNITNIFIASDDAEGAKRGGVPAGKSDVITRPIAEITATHVTPIPDGVQALLDKKNPTDNDQWNLLRAIAKKVYSL